MSGATRSAVDGFRCAQPILRFLTVAPGMTDPRLVNVGSEQQRPNTYVGAPIERVEDLRLLRGRGCYLDDLARSGQWHAAFVRSPFAHGAIRRLETHAAHAMRGVQA